MGSEDLARIEKRRVTVESRNERERKADQLTKAVLAEEDARRATDAKKTARLKSLRLAKEATESEVLAGSTKRTTEKRTTGKKRRPDLKNMENKKSTKVKRGDREIRYDLGT